MKITRVFQHLQANGFVETYRYAVYWLSEYWNDRYYGIETRVPARHLEDFDIHNDEFVGYMPATFGSIRAALRHATITPDDVFVEYGAGKGRVVVLAATAPFKRVIGVELVPAFAEEARANVKRARVTLRAGAVEIVEANATEYALPDDATVLHFYKPFHGATMVTVWEDILASLTRTPRRITILFGHYDEFEPLAAACAWVTDRQDLTWPPVDPGGNGYRIYTVDPAAAPTPAA